MGGRCQQIWRVAGRESGSPELLQSPRTSPQVPRTSPFAGDFPGSSLTVELNSNSDSEVQCPCRTVFPVVSQTIAATPPFLSFNNNGLSLLTRGGASRKKLPSDAYRAIGSVVRNGIANRAIVGSQGLSPLLSFFFSLLLFVSLRFPPFFLCTGADNCNLQRKMGVLLRPNLHRPCVKLPEKRTTKKQIGTDKSKSGHSPLSEPRHFSVRVLFETNFEASKTLYFKACWSLKNCLD